jgi:hypothetical protein
MPAAPVADPAFRVRVSLERQVITDEKDDSYDNDETHVTSFPSMP